MALDGELALEKIMNLS